MTQTTVYVIDDEIELVEWIRDVVELADLQAQTYTQASDFFEQVTTFSSHSILILDLNMPQMDGIEVMRRLANMASPPSLILISGHDIGILHSAEKLGQAHHLKIIASLVKPLVLDNLLQLLQQHTATDSTNQHNTIQKLNDDPTAGELHQAICNDQMVLHYQPQVEFATGRLIGVEALVRWQYTGQVLIYPDHFITLAEESGLMADLTHWVINQVMQQERLWQNDGLKIGVSVNISASDITSLTLPEQLIQLLKDNELDPTLLTLEVTESALMGELVTSLDILTRLRLKGTGLSIDDFGTGYSSLSQLHKIPFTELKIDRSFVANITEDPEARAIVKTCIMLGNELNMTTVAEGVEDQQTWDILAELGCDLAQGYFIARPMPAAELLAWSRSRIKSDG